MRDLVESILHLQRHGPGGGTVDPDDRHPCQSLHYYEDWRQQPYVEPRQLATGLSWGPQLTQHHRRPPVHL